MADRCATCGGNENRGVDDLLLVTCEICGRRIHGKCAYTIGQHAETLGLPCGTLCRRCYNRAKGMKRVLIAMAHITVAMSDARALLREEIANG